MLPELEALAKVLEMEETWKQDAAALRLGMLDIISSIAESYIKAGTPATLWQSYIMQRLYFSFNAHELKGACVLSPSAHS